MWFYSYFLKENAARSPLEELDENHDDLSEGEEEKFSSPVTEASQAPPVVKEVKPDLSEGEEEKFSSPAPEASPAPPAAQEVPKKKVPTSPEPTKKLSTHSSEPEVNFKF